MATLWNSLRILYGRVLLLTICSLYFGSHLIQRLGFLLICGQYLVNLQPLNLILSSWLVHTLFVYLVVLYTLVYLSRKNNIKRR